MSRTCRRTLTLLVIFLAAPAAFQAMAEDDFWRFDKFWSEPRKAMVDISYGTPSLKHRLFGGDLDRVGSIEVELGYSKPRPAIENIVELNEKYLFFNYASSSLFGRALDPAKVTGEISRFGFGGREGYAYDFTSSYLYPYTETGLQWVKLTATRPVGLSANDAAILDRYDGSFRFSSTAEAGVAFGLSDIGAIRAGYEFIEIYPRHVFWPWVGSYGIAMIGMGAISHFGEKIVESSPVMGPVIYTLLRGGLAYGYYLLVRDNQYWPFRSETPMTAEGFKVGITLTF